MKIGQYIRSCPWGDLSPTTMKETGLGGRETALLQLGENWAKSGHEVINFVPIETPEKTEYENGGVVYYVPAKDIIPYCRNFGLDVLVSWEEAGAFEVPDIIDNVKLKVIEMQVAHLNSDEKTDVNIDYYAVLSNWAGEFLKDQNPYIADEKVVVFPNGVDLGRYENGEPEAASQGKSFYYSSSPDRGLIHLLDMWPKIRERYPEAILHVAYGIEKWVEAVKWSHNMQAEMAIDIVEGLKQDGVIYHGKIGQDELAKIQQTCTALLYPCDTMSPTETGCITVVEAGAAGCPAVITDCDCLGSEFGHIYPSINLPFDEAKYLAVLFDLLEDEKYFESVKLNGYKLADSREWSYIASQWLEFFNEKLYEIRETETNGAIA